MTAGHAKALTRQWIETDLALWPGLRAAHLVGGLTSMPDHAPFPIHKDVDLHLIFDEGSPALVPDGPFANLIEVEYRGLLIEAGSKPVGDYRSAEAVLANPEIAHHLTLDSVLYDPTGLLREVQGPVRRDFARRRWVRARVDAEQAALQHILAMLPAARAMWGAAGEVNILGYSFTRPTAALADATLRPPRIGARMLLHLRDRLVEIDRLDLYEAALAVLGLAGVTPKRVEQHLHETAAAFDLAVQVRQTPHPFQHKLHAHLRPYFVSSCREMLDEGHHREALLWIVAYATATTGVILADGPLALKPAAAERLAVLLRELDMEAAEARAAAFERAQRLHKRLFALAAGIIERHPLIRD